MDMTYCGRCRGHRGNGGNDRDSMSYVAGGGSDCCTSKNLILCVNYRVTRLSSLLTDRSALSRSCCRM